jgi:hypothetical protein
MVPKSPYIALNGLVSSFHPLSYTETVSTFFLVSWNKAGKAGFPGISSSLPEEVMVAYRISNTKETNANFRPLHSVDPVNKRLRGTYFTL